MDALDRIEDGTFGKCVRCGRQIAEERLEAIPYATRCIDCQRLAERA
jgi:RNA polymerase-binding transcription factor DksA